MLGLGLLLTVGSTLLLGLTLGLGLGLLLTFVIIGLGLTLTLLVTCCGLSGRYVLVFGRGRRGGGGGLKAPLGPPGSIGACCDT